MEQHQGRGWLKVKKYTFMSAAADLAALQTALLILLCRGNATEN
jgi:hypothetical protein